MIRHMHNYLHFKFSWLNFHYTCFKILNAVSVIFVIIYVLNKLYSIPRGMNTHFFSSFSLFLFCFVYLYHLNLLYFCALCGLDFSSKQTST